MLLDFIFKHISLFGNNYRISAHVAFSEHMLVLRPVFRIRIRIRMDPYHLVGSGSVWIRIIWLDPDPYQETIDMDPGSVKN